MPCPKIIALDMDGTLLDEHGRIPDAFWELLRLADDREVLVTPASGRQLATLRDMFTTHQPHTFIAENGSVVFHDGRIIDVTAMPEQPVREFLRAFETAPFSASAVLCTPEQSYSLRGASKEVEQEIAKYYHANTNVDSLVDVPFEQPVKVALYVDGDAERDALAWVQAHAPGLHHVVSGQHWIDIMSPEADKGKALLAIADALGVPQEATAAIGDFLNDYTMLQAAGTAVAMGNAHPDLKKVADEVIGTNAEHAAVHRLAAWLSEQ
ncbi:HAD family hydrolase [Corynebacterium sp. UMB10119B.1]|uniref:HAD family hydrolase n=1 Tax=Corynebacterium sp. UMB10119B.1 TaxID=3050601 RepID=UPI00254BB3AF|nr:HAD family hydrolase [Corynebacterium sp. UMB10119B]MDK8363391.1 HAD family hydrolase [Corynebacterium sp. UMB10119B]